MAQSRGGYGGHVEGATHERGQSWQSLAWAKGRWRVLYGIARPQEKGALASALAERLGQQQLRATSSMAMTVKMMLMMTMMMR